MRGGCLGDVWMRWWTSTNLRPQKMKMIYPENESLRLCFAFGVPGTKGMATLVFDHRHRWNARPKSTNSLVLTRSA